MDTIFILAIVGSLIFAWRAETPWVWRLLGLAMIVGSLLNCWWANYVMQSPDREAPFVVGAMGFCFFIPLSGLCFLMAGVVGLNRTKTEDPKWDEGLRETIEPGLFFRNFDDEADAEKGPDTPRGSTRM